MAHQSSTRGSHGLQFQKKKPTVQAFLSDFLRHGILVQFYSPDSHLDLGVTHDDRRTDATQLQLSYHRHVPEIGWFVVEALNQLEGLLPLGCVEQLELIGQTLGLVYGLKEY